MAAKKMTEIQAFEGLISAPFTAFKANGDLNVEIIPDYIDHLVKQGVTGAFVNGTTGEGLSLTVAERKLIAETWVKYSKNKLEIVIIQVGANSIKDARELASHAEKIGATAIATLPPLFYKPSSNEQLIAYLKSIADAAPTLPLMLYHIPMFSGVEINVAQLLPEARASIPSFCGAKFTSTDVRDLLNCHRLPGEPFKVMPGFEDILLPSLSCGPTAAIGAAYNFMGPLCLKVVQAFKRGDVKKAREIQNEIMNAILTIQRHGHGTSCSKAVMNMLGPLNFGEPRLPLTPLKPDALELLKADLKNLKAENWSKI